MHASTVEAEHQQIEACSALSCACLPPFLFILSRYQTDTHPPGDLKASSGMEGLVVIKVAAEHTDKDTAKSIANSSVSQAIATTRTAGAGAG